MNPEHAALISKAIAFFAPISFCTRQATEGVNISGVIVATTIKSISSPLSFDLWSAIFAALMEIWDVSSPSEILLSFIPVLEVIHSSLVSTILDKSSFVITSEGA